MSPVGAPAQSLPDHHSSELTNHAGRYAQAIVRTMQQPVLVLTRELQVEFANPAFHQTFQVPPSETVGHRLYDLGNGQWDIPALHRLLEEVSGNQKDVQDYRVEHAFEHIGQRTFLLNATCLELAETGVDGRILLAFSDITEEERYRLQTETQKEFAEKTLDSVRDALLILDSGLHVKSANTNFYRMFQVDPQETEGQAVYELGNRQWNYPRFRELLEQILPESNTFDNFEIEHDFPQIGHKVMLLNARRIDHLQWILLAIQDITEQRRREGEQKLLMGELQHRVKNILMNVRALARQTRQRSQGLEQFSEAFEGRLEALSRTQDLLVRSEADTVQIADLLRFELQALGAEEGANLRLDGPPWELPARIAHPMGMTVHELATNAAKHGALSTDAGTLTITWTTDRQDGRQHVRFHWRERGVPLSAPPSRKGFGTELIERGLPYLFGGSSHLAFHPDGVECQIEFFLPIE
jgi:two-component sensor histidine kinase